MEGAGDWAGDFSGFPEEGAWAISGLFSSSLLSQEPGSPVSPGPFFQCWVSVSHSLVLPSLSFPIWRAEIQQCLSRVCRH
jgi:hypothetical protein